MLGYICFYLFFIAYEIYYFNSMQNDIGYFGSGMATIIQVIVTFLAGYNLIDFITLLS